MAQQRGKTGKSRRLHLEVANLHALVLERLNLLVLIRVGNVGTELTALRAVETTAGYGIALDHVVGSNLVDEVGIGYCNVGCTLDGIPLHVLLESLLHLDVADNVASCVIVEQAVETDALDGCDERPRGCEGL